MSTIPSRSNDATIPDTFPFLGNRSGIGEMIRAFDWRTTALGELSRWPGHLRSITALMLHSDVPMTLQWGRQGWMIYNDAYCEIAGSRHPELLGKSLLESWPELAEFRTRAVNHVLEGNALSFRDEHVVLQRNGTSEDLWLDIDYSPVVDETGTPVGVLAILKDTTRRFRNEQHLHMAQKAGGVGTFELYPECGRLDVSDEFRHIWGLDADVEVTVQLLSRLVHPDDRDAMGTQRSDRSDRLAYAEFRRVDPLTGEIRWIARSGEVVSLDGTAPRFVGIAMDITDRKRSEQALSESESRVRELAEKLDVKVIRHRNVRLLMKQLALDAERSGRRSAGTVMLAEMLRKSVAQVSRFAAEKPVTPIGDRIAREIEEAFGKAHGWMDHVHGD